MFVFPGGKALLDPIIVTNGLAAYDSGVLPNPNEISDHLATYIVLPHDYSVSSTYILIKGLILPNLKKT